VVFCVRTRTGVGGRASGAMRGKLAPTLPLLRKVRCPPRGPLFVLGRSGDENLAARLR